MKVVVEMVIIVFKENLIDVRFGYFMGKCFVDCCGVLKEKFKILVKS